MQHALGCAIKVPRPPRVPSRGVLSALDAHWQCGHLDAKAVPTTHSCPRWGRGVLCLRRPSHEVRVSTLIVNFLFVAIYVIKPCTGIASSIHRVDHRSGRRESAGLSLELFLPSAPAGPCLAERSGWGFRAGTRGRQKRWEPSELHRCEQLSPLRTGIKYSAHRK